MEEAEGELESLARLGTRSWINMQMKGFKAGEQAQPVDVQLYTLLRKLELLAEDTEADMQSTSVSLVRAMPRAVVDLATLQDAAAELREAIAGLADELRALEMQSTASLGLLVEAEHVKKRMLAVAQTLEQAQQLAQTLQAAEGAVARGELGAAASQVGRASAGLSALERVPRFRDARAKVGTLTSTLLSQLEPKLVAALHERDAHNAKELCAAFATLGHEGAVEALFVQTRQGPLYELWNAQPRPAGGAAGSAGEGGAGAAGLNSVSAQGMPLASFREWLPAFHAALSDAARAELAFAASAGLRRRRLLVARLLTETLGALTEQYAVRLIEVGTAPPSPHAPEELATGAAGNSRGSRGGAAAGASSAEAAGGWQDGEGAEGGEGADLAADAVKAPVARFVALDREGRAWAAALSAELGCAATATMAQEGASAAEGTEADASLRAACGAPYAKARLAYARMESSYLRASLQQATADLQAAAGQPAAIVGALARALPAAAAALAGAPRRCAWLCGPLEPGEASAPERANGDGGGRGERARADSRPLRVLAAGAASAPDAEHAGGGSALRVPALGRPEAVAAARQAEAAMAEVFEDVHSHASSALVRLRLSLQLPPAQAAAPEGALAAPAGAAVEVGSAGAAHAWAHLGDSIDCLALCGTHVSRVADLSAELARLCAAVAASSPAPATTSAPAGAHLAAARAGASELAQSARDLVADCAFAPVRAQLATFAKLGAWASAARPSFSASALSYATAIGEHLLMLPQALEPHAHRGALALGGSGGARAAAGGDSGQGDGGGGGGGGSGDVEASDAADAVFEWLELLCARTVAELLERAAQLRTLTPAGAQQLGADLGYLKMVISSGLGLDPDGRLVALEAALLAEAEGAGGLAALRDSVASASAGTDAVASPASPHGTPDDAPAVRVPARIVAALIAAREAGGSALSATGAGGGSAEACGSAFEI